MMERQRGVRTDKLPSTELWLLYNSVPFRKRGLKSLGVKYHDPGNLLFFF